jgi:hypothetical protein
VRTRVCAIPVCACENVDRCTSPNYKQSKDVTCDMLMDKEMFMNICLGGYTPYYPLDQPVTLNLYLQVNQSGNICF